MQSKEKTLVIYGKDLNSEYVPTEKQALFHKSTARYRCYAGGFGSGKTKCITVEALLLALEYPNNLGVICRWTYPELRDTTRRTFFENLGVTADSAAGHPLVKKWNKAENELVLRTEKGESTILFRALKDGFDKVKSLNLGFFVLDEASEIPEDIFRALQGRLRRPRVRHCGLLATNTEGHNWVWRLFKNNSDPNYFLVEASSFENPHLPEGYVESLLEDYPEAWVKRYVYGSWDAFEGLVYPEFDPAIHVVSPFEVPSEWPKFASLDYGFTNPQAWIKAALDEDGNIWVIDEIYEAGKDVSWWKAAIAARGKDVEFTVGCPKFFEKGADGITVASLYEAPPDPVVLIRADVKIKARVQKLSMLLKPRPEKVHPITGKPGAPGLFIMSNCRNLINEITSYEWRRLPLSQSDKKEVPEAPKEGNDHAVEALERLVWYIYEKPISKRMRRKDGWVEEEEERRDPIESVLYFPGDWTKAF